MRQLNKRVMVTATCTTCHHILGYERDQRWLSWATGDHALPSNTSLWDHILKQNKNKIVFKKRSKCTQVKNFPEVSLLKVINFLARNWAALRSNLVTLWLLYLQSYLTLHELKSKKKAIWRHGLYYIIYFTSSKKVRRCLTRSGRNYKSRYLEEGYGGCDLHIS